MSIWRANHLRSPKKLQNLQKVQDLRQNATGPWRRTRRRRRSAFESIQKNSTALFDFLWWFKPFKCGSNRVPSDAVTSVMMGSGTVRQEWPEDTMTSRNRTQSPQQPHHRSTTTGTNRQNTTSNVTNDADTRSTNDTNINISVTNATNASHDNRTAHTNVISRTVTDTTLTGGINDDVARTDTTCTNLTGGLARLTTCDRKHHRH